MEIIIICFQVDDLQKEVLALKDRVNEQRTINESRASKQEENMNGLRTHLQQLSEDAEREAERIKTVQTELSKLLDSVEKLFLSIHCDHSAMYKILGKFLVVTSQWCTFILYILCYSLDDFTYDMKLKRTIFFFLNSPVRWIQEKNFKC